MSRTVGPPKFISAGVERVYDTCPSIVLTRFANNDNQIYGPLDGLGELDDTSTREDLNIYHYKSQCKTGDHSCFIPFDKPVVVVRIKPEKYSIMPYRA